MTKQTPFTRRQFIGLAGLSALGLAAGNLLPYSFGKPVSAATEFVPDVEINLTAVVTTIPIFSGQETTIWQYQGTLVQGDSSNLIPLANSYLGPVIHVRTGQKVRINFTNMLAEESIIHWHGLHVPHEADGHPSQVIANGETYVYEFTVMDQAGTYWYHPHPHGRTATQAYMGLASLFLISDAQEDAAGLPTGAHDLPLAIQDRTFDASNQLVYSASTAGFLGDQIFINGRPNTAALEVEAVPVRLRILNGSNSRIYKLAWADSTPLTVIGTDGGLLPTPVARSYVTMAPGERVELLIDFSQWTVGDTVSLRSLAYSGAVGNNTTLPPGSAFTVATFHINPPAASLDYKLYLPMISSQGGNTMVTPEKVDAVAVTVDRSFATYMQQGNWTINGRVFEMTAVVAEEIVTIGTQEVWEFNNNSPTGMGMGQPHPMHMHGLQYQVLARIAPVDNNQYNDWLTVKDGYVDDGRKDTVLVMPGEKVQIAVQFEDFTGLFLYHCHNLEHEDMGMMRNYRVDAV